jgi:hypothetical protein
VAVGVGVGVAVARAQSRKLKMLRRVGSHVDDSLSRQKAKSAGVSQAGRALAYGTLLCGAFGFAGTSYAAYRLDVSPWHRPREFVGRLRVSVKDSFSDSVRSMRAWWPSHSKSVQHTIRDSSLGKWTLKSRQDSTALQEQKRLAARQKQEENVSSSDEAADADAATAAAAAGSGEGTWIDKFNAFAVAQDSTTAAEEEFQATAVEEEEEEEPEDTTH